MVHVRVVAPPEIAEAAYSLLREHPSAINLVRLAGAAERPQEDVILCDVASEDASVVVAELRELGLERAGSIALAPLSSLVSDAARRAEEVAVGSPADAVVWETVEFQTSEQAELSVSFLALMTLATMIGPSSGRLPGSRRAWCSVERILRGARCSHSESASRSASWPRSC